MIETLIILIVKLFVIGVVFWFVWWGVEKIAELITKEVEDPFQKAIRIVVILIKVILIIVAVMFCIDLLLGLSGTKLKLP